MSLSESLETHWFAEEVQPHAPVLRAYLQGRFPTLPDVDNVVQESLVRVLRARQKGEVKSSKALLFAIARNLACDAVRREGVLTFEPISDYGELSRLADDTDVVESISKKQELDLLAQAIQSLPTRCRQVFTLRVAYAMSQKEIAAKLDISENTVEKQIAKANKRCGDFLARFGCP